MKIILAGPAWPYRGGIAEFSNRLMKQFVDEGHEVKIITFRLQYPRFLFPGKSQLIDSPAPANIPINRWLNSVNPLNWIVSGIKIRRARPDILVTRFWLPFMGPCLGTVARIARSNRHTKVICIFDNVIPHEKRPGDRLFTRYFAHSIDCGIALAKVLADDLRSIRKDLNVKIGFHPLYDNYGNSLPQENAKIQLGLDINKKYVLFFGFIRKYKGLDLLLKAFASSYFKENNIELLVAGEFYDDESPYRKIVSDNNLVDDVIFFNRFISDNEVSAFFSAADIVAQPYRTATQSGVSQIAFNFDKPVVVTDVGGLREIVPDKEGGYVVDSDPEQIASALIDFFKNNRKESFTEFIKEHKKKFLWDKMTSIILDCYREAPR
ncbi:MAG TPA: glycosyltransferase [Bacteroidales bacterium]|nr:glycosyltransferase [Bacteroidales bacterium]